MMTSFFMLPFQELQLTVLFASSTVTRGPVLCSGTTGSTSARTYPTSKVSKEWTGDEYIRGLGELLDTLLSHL